MTSKLTFQIEVETYFEDGELCTFLWLDDDSDPSLAVRESLMDIAKREIEGMTVRGDVHPQHYEELEMLINKLREASDYLWDQLMVSKKVEEAKEVLSKHKT